MAHGIKRKLLNWHSTPLPKKNMKSVQKVNSFLTTVQLRRMRLAENLSIGTRPSSKKNVIMVLNCGNWRKKIRLIKKSYPISKALWLRKSSLSGGISYWSIQIFMWMRPLTLTLFIDGPSIICQVDNKLVHILIWCELKVLPTCCKSIAFIL